MNNSGRTSLQWFGLLALFAVQVQAQAPARPAELRASLADLTLEQLASIEVTSVSKRAQRLADVAGSVYLITADEIRRSGASTLPEVLRLAPNLQVARADANQYAISARGFNSVLANKMLVLVDGRTVYSPLFSGVFWEERDVLLEDVERIEVLSGSGGTLYGSNAVNGVINIITRSAADTQGVLASATLGSTDRGATVRYGAAAGEGFKWRLYGKRTLLDHTWRTTGLPVRDASGRSRVGFRADRAGADSQFTLQGDLYDNRIDQAPSARRVRGGNLLARYGRDLGAAGQWKLQAYFDRTERDQPGTIHDLLDTVDLDFQYLWQPRPGHQLIWGGGWRRQHDNATSLNPAALSFRPPKVQRDLLNAFVQDEIELGDRLRVTLGLKAEHNDYTGMEFLPNARLAWQAGAGELLWAAASRTVRAPARVDREFFSPVVAGGPNFRSEVARVYEVGWRAQPLQQLSYSLTLFHHDVDRLRSLDVTPGGVTLNNNYHARLNGLEGWGQWRLGERARLQAGFAHQRLRVGKVAGTAPLQDAASLGNDPRNRLTLGLAWDLGRNMELDVRARRIGKLPSPAVPGYTAVDLRWGWQVRRDLELSLVVRNLTDRRHAEWGAPANRAEFDRSVALKAVWHLQGAGR